MLPFPISRFILPYAIFLRCRASRVESLSSRLRVPVTFFCRDSSLPSTTPLRSNCERALSGSRKNPPKFDVSGRSNLRNFGCYAKQCAAGMHMLSSARCCNGHIASGCVHGSRPTDRRDRPTDKHAEKENAIRLTDRNAGS